MSKKDEFKSFVVKHPEISSKVMKNEVTWQKLFELYDMYGEEESVWEKYIKKEEIKEQKSSGVEDLVKSLKGVNMENVQKYIGTAQKAIGVISELVAGSGSAEVAKNVTSPRPIGKFFGD